MRFRKRNAITVLLMASLIVAQSHARGETKLIEKKGQVQARIPDTEWYNAPDNLSVREKMSIRTAKASRATLSFSVDSTVIMLSNTEITVKSDLGKKPPAGGDPNLLFDTGTIIIKTTNKTDRNEIRVSTPTALITTKKSVVTIKTDGDKLTVLGVVEGKACASAKGKTVCAGESQVIVVKANGSPSMPGAPDADTLALWKAENLKVDKDAAAKPSLVVYQPDDGAMFNKPFVAITGKTSGSSLTINGDKTEIHNGGEFSARTKLSEGENKIVVEASNGDLKRTVQLKVYVDTTPPMLTISQPMSGFDPYMLGRCDSRRCLIQIFGITEPGVTLYANRMDVSKFVESDGSFFITEFPLDTSETTLIMEAEDQFRQRTRQVISVSPPLDSDGDGTPDQLDACPADPTCR